MTFKSLRVRTLGRLFRSRRERRIFKGTFKSRSSIGFVLAILLAIRKIGPYLYLCVRMPLLAEQSFRSARCLRNTAIRSYLSILESVGSDLR